MSEEVLRNIWEQVTASGTYKALYYAPLQAQHEKSGNRQYKKNFYKQIWDYSLMGGVSQMERGWTMYASSEFCYQPFGDSPTRRAFWDCWMFGVRIARFLFVAREGVCGSVLTSILPARGARCSPKRGTFLSSVANQTRNPFFHTK